MADELLARHVPELIRKNYVRSQGTERYTGLGKGGGREKYKNEFVSAVGKILTNVVAEL